MSSELTVSTKTRYHIELEHEILVIRAQLSSSVDRYHILMKEYDGSTDHDKALDLVRCSVGSASHALKLSLRELRNLESNAGFFTKLFQQLGWKN
jgi:hypothetical protein